MADYIQQLTDDIIEQFKGKPNIAAIMEAVAVQLQDVADFYTALRDERSLHTAIGKQLDGSGDIVVLNRAEAGQMASYNNPGEAISLDDELYRKFLIFKVLKNTSISTYPDIIKSFKMFWDKPLYYSENPEEPATMTFRTGTLTPEDNASLILNAPIIRAAGVGINIIATTETPLPPRTLHITPVMGRGYMSTRLPVREYREAHATTQRVSAAGHSIMQTRLPDRTKEED